MKKLSLKIALLAGLGLYFSASDLFAQCACVKVGDDSYQCCAGGDYNSYAPSNNGNGYYICPSSGNMAFFQKGLDSCCSSNTSENPCLSGSSSSFKK